MRVRPELRMKCYRGPSFFYFYFFFLLKYIPDEQNHMCSCLPFVQDAIFRVCRVMNYITCSIADSDASSKYVLPKEGNNCTELLLFNIVNPW